MAQQNMVQLFAPIISVIIASIALLVSWLTHLMAKANFHLSNRPYVTVKNSAEKDTDRQNPRKVEFMCIKMGDH